MKRGRHPRGVLKSAIYARVHAAAPTINLYAVVPIGNEEFPYVTFGSYSATRDTESKSSSSWNGTFSISCYGHSTETDQLDYVIDDVIDALTLNPLDLTGNWRMVDQEVASVAVKETVRDEFGVLLEGTISFQFEVIDLEA